MKCDFCGETHPVSLPIKAIEDIKKHALSEDVEITRLIHDVVRLADQILDTKLMFDSGESK